VSNERMPINQVCNLDRKWLGGVAYSNQFMVVGKPTHGSSKL